MPVKGVDVAIRPLDRNRPPAAEVLDAAALTISKLWEVFRRRGRTLVGSTLVRTPDDQILALDGKVTLDGNR